MISTWRHAVPLTRLRCGRKPADPSKMSRWARILDQPSGQISIMWYIARPGFATPTGLQKKGAETRLERPQSSKRAEIANVESEIKWVSKIVQKY